jgi:hypothetical protein
MPGLPFHNICHFVNSSSLELGMQLSGEHLRPWVPSPAPHPHTHTHTHSSLSLTHLSRYDALLMNPLGGTPRNMSVCRRRIGLGLGELGGQSAPVSLCVPLRFLCLEDNLCSAWLMSLWESPLCGDSHAQP